MVYKIQSLSFVCVKIVGEAAVCHGVLVRITAETDLRARTDVSSSLGKPFQKCWQRVGGGKSSHEGCAKVG